MEGCTLKHFYRVAGAREYSGRLAYCFYCYRPTTQYHQIADTCLSRKGYRRHTADLTKK